MEQHLLSTTRSRALWHALVATIAWLAIATTPAAANPSEPLSLGAAARSAPAHSRALQASDAAAAGAREMAVAAAQRPDPVLRLSLDNLPVNGPDRFSTTRDFMTMRSIALMQTLPNADKRRARGERFEREADAALSERAQTRERALQVQRWQQDWRAGRDRLAYPDAHRQPLATQRVDAALPTELAAAHPSATYLRPKLRQTTTGILPIRLLQRPDLNQLASSKCGAAQCDDVIRASFSFNCHVFIAFGPVTALNNLAWHIGLSGRDV